MRKIGENKSCHCNPYEVAIPRRHGGRDSAPAVLRRPGRKTKRGAVIVEMAIAATFLMIFLFGTIQVCLLFQDQTGLANITRVTARCLSMGDTVSVAETTGVKSSQSRSFTTGNITWNCQYSVDGGTTWSSLASSTSTAPTNSLVRVQTSFVHKFETKVLGGGNITLTKNVVYHHE